jgi:hypothetical protein
MAVCSVNGLQLLFIYDGGNKFQKCSTSLLYGKFGFIPSAVPQRDDGPRFHSTREMRANYHALADQST